MYVARTVDRAHRLHALPGLAAVSPGIHRQRAADRAGNAGEKFGGAEPPAYALPRQLRAGNAAAGTHEVGVDALQVPEDAGRGYDHAPQAPVPDQQVAADAQPENRHVRIEFAQESLQILDARRNEEELGVTAGAPRHVAAHRLVAPQFAPSMHLFQRRRHECTLRFGLLPSSCGSLAA